MGTEEDIAMFYFVAHWHPESRWLGRTVGDEIDDISIGRGSNLGMNSSRQYQPLENTLMDRTIFSRTK